MMRISISAIVLIILTACSPAKKNESNQSDVKVEAPENSYDSLSSELEAFKKKIEAMPDSYEKTEYEKKFELLDDVMSDIEKQDRLLDSMKSFYPADLNIDSIINEKTNGRSTNLRQL